LCRQSEQMSKEIQKENIQSQMRKGLLEYCVLGMLHQHEMYPGDMIAGLKYAGLVILEGTLYPLLTRLKNGGYLQYRWEESQSGPPRKYFLLTEEGKKLYEMLHQTWMEISQSVNQINQTTNNS